VVDSVIMGPTGAFQNQDNCCNKVAFRLSRRKRRRLCCELDKLVDVVVVVLVVVLAGEEEGMTQIEFDIILWYRCLERERSREVIDDNNEYKTHTETEGDDRVYCLAFYSIRKAK